MTVRLRSRALLLVFALFAVVAAFSAEALGQTTTLTPLHVFPVGGAGYNNSYNYGPFAGVVQGSDGNFYGTTVYGGAYNEGSVFKITSGGSLTTLYNFCSEGGNCLDGAEPYAGLVQGSDGNFYGMTRFGGEGIYDSNELPVMDCEGCGTIFKITPGGTLTTLYSFCVYGYPYDDCPDGSEPSGTLVQGSDGNFYGTAFYGGSNFEGVIFKITSSGTYTVLYDFGTDSGGVIDGGYPQTGLVQGSDGNFYGGTETSRIFKITPGGTLTTLYTAPTDFDFWGGLIEGADGNFYGTTFEGGGSSGPCGLASDECSTIYKMTPSGSLTTLYSFCSQSDCSDGDETWAGLVLGSDGNFYGTNYLFGEYGAGTIFKITSGGSLSTIYAFTGGSDSGGPTGSLIQGQDGNFYGTTSGYVDDGTRKDGGSIFKLSFSTPLAPPVKLSLSDSTVEAGTPVTLTWTVSNAFSMTLQQCQAFVQNVATGAGTWTGLQAGKIVNGVYTGSASITPTAAGTYTYALTCGGQESGFATLTVTSSPGSITFSSTTHNFGSVIDGTTAAAYGVKLTNPNSTIFPFTMNLTGASSFTQVNNCGTQVAAGGTCEIVFYFKPTSTGAQTATWNLTANGETFSPANGGTLSGTGVNDGSLSLTTSVHNFGDQTVGTTSGVYGTVLTNSYAFPVTLAFSTTGNTTDFTTTANNCGTTLRANASCNLQYTFNPKVDGFLTETMGIAATYNGSPVTIMSLGSPVTGVVLKGTGD